MDKNKVIALLLLMVIGAFGGAAVARADGDLSAYEKYIGDEVHVSLCRLLDIGGTNDETLATIITILHDKGELAWDDTPDVVNYVVQEYCPRHWDDLVAVGNRYRAGMTANTKVA